LRILGIDYGDSNIGLALSDPLGYTAQGLDTVKNKSDKNAAKKIIEVIEHRGVEKVVIGYPKNMNGTIGARGQKTDEFIGIMQEYMNKNDVLKKIQIIKWDERLTTKAALRHMNETNVNKNKKKKIVDQIAAVYILQGYLDSI
jgi:putative holliday junction resolvase